MLMCRALWRHVRRQVVPPYRARPKVRAVLLAALAVGACDFPTAPPVLQPRFVLPGENTTLGVDQLLPAGVTVAGSNFRLALSPTQLPTRTLAELCGAPCVAAHGMRVPKPAFEATLETTVPTPVDVAGAMLSSGSIRISLTHSFGFDPVRPPGAAQAGSLRLVVVSAGRDVGNVTVTDPFPSGTTLQRTVQLNPGPIGSDLRVRVELVSPAGGTEENHHVQINADAALAGTATPLTIEVSEATVRVQNREVSVAQTQIDLSGIDQSLRNRVRSGTLTLIMTNPYGVSGTLQLRLIGGGTVTKSIVVQPNQTVQRIDFTEAELQALLGHNVLLQISGPVSAPAGTVTIRPTDTLTIETRLELTLEIG
jgi:hypothetical protein